MKTIEERATEYVMPIIDDHSEGNLMTIRLAYMYGAKEQQQIDIERAVLWLKCRSEYPFSDEIINGFRKFMEE